VNEAHSKVADDRNTVRSTDIIGPVRPSLGEKLAGAVHPIPGRALAVMASFAAVILGSFVYSPPARASAAAATFSGYEIFPGVTSSSDTDSFGGCSTVPAASGRATSGATFAGWTDNASVWVSPRSRRKGIVNGSVDYIGAPGLGNTVCLTGGMWSWQRSAKIFSGSVTGGSIVWPNGGDDNGCGTDVGVFTAELSVAGGGGTGEIKGCLNDQTDLLIPKIKIWGKLLLAR
jgi:hypothetical protein